MFHEFKQIKMVFILILRGFLKSQIMFSMKYNCSLKSKNSFNVEIIGFYSDRWYIGWNIIEITITAYPFFLQWDENLRQSSIFQC